MTVDAPEVVGRLEEAAGGRVRDAVPTDAVDGVSPRVVVSPADPDQVSQVMSVCQELGLAVVPRGGGTHLLQHQQQLPIQAAQGLDRAVPGLLQQRWQRAVAG